MPRWRRDSIFGPGPRPRQPLDRNRRARLLYLARLHRAPGRLSAGALDVAVALLRLLGSDGRLDASHATLAAVHVATVQRALVRLRELGLVRWIQRLVRDGWRTEQTSNAYALCPTSENPSAACDVQIARAVKLVASKKAAVEVEQGALEVRETDRHMLAAIRRRREAVLGLAWASC